uniref:Uncharacterized protein n=1 Tax=Chenopodium quinoa TaxID=63459 RepID=A0A803L4E6_CHEQI
MLKRPQKKPVIPVEFLLLMGTCDVTIHGTKVTAHVANCVAAVDKHIADLRSYLECNTKVVGLDVKKIKHGHYYTQVIVLYNKICFVGVTELPTTFSVVKFSYSRVGVKIGDLAARVLNKPVLIESSLIDLANQVGVPYDGPTSATSEIEIDSRNSMVFTDEHVVAAASDAYAYYQIGHKLLTSL